MIPIIIAILPVVLILLYINYRDKREKEPLGQLLLVFFMGAIATLPIILIENLFTNLKPAIIGRNNMSIGALFSFYDAFIVAGFTEEVLKFIVLYILTWNNKNFNERFDGIVYAVFVSLGFACVENVLYVFGYGLGVGIVRAFLTVPFHALAGIVMGYFFSIARFSPYKKRLNLFKAIFYAIIVHGIYDFLIMYMEFEGEKKPALVGLLTLIFLIFMVWLWIQGFRKIKKLANTNDSNINS